MKCHKICVLILAFFYVTMMPLKAQQKSMKIGFVNLKNIFRDYKKVKKMEESIRRETQQELAKIKELREQTKQLREEIPLYRPGSKIRKRKEKELTEKLFEIKFKEEKANHFFTQKMKAGIEQVYREIAKEIERYAKKHNFYMVLRVADADFFGSKSPEALRMQIHTRDVLYWSKKYDITNIIISRMNKKFKAGKKSFKK